MEWTMEWTRVLLLSAVLGQIWAHVPPVTNVTLDCHNFQNTLRWTYSHKSGSPTPRFRVNVNAHSGTHEPLWVDYPELQCNLSSFSHPDNDYLVNVTAVVGLEESPLAPPGGLVFSYNQNTPIGQQCTLDLPSINVTAQSDVGIRFSFFHPSVVYRHKLLAGPHRQQRKRGGKRDKNISNFTYMVVMTRNNTRFDFSCATEVCEDKIAVALQPGSNCVKINGDWEDMTVRGTGDYCAQAILPSTSTGPFGIGYLILLIILGMLVMLVVLILLCYLKNISGFTSLPVVLDFDKDNQKKSGDAPLILDYPTVTLMSSDPSATDQPPTKEEQELVRTKPELLLPIGQLLPPVLLGRDIPLDIPSAIPAAPRDHPAAAADEEQPQQPNEGVGEDAEEGGVVQNHLGYEPRSRQVEQVEIAQGDNIDAYRY